LELYEYDCRFQSDGSAAYAARFGFIQMSLRHINRFHSDAAAAHKIRLPVSNRCRYGA